MLTAYRSDRGSKGGFFLPCTAGRLSQRLLSRCHYDTNSCMQDVRRKITPNSRLPVFVHGLNSPDRALIAFSRTKWKAELVVDAADCISSSAATVSCMYPANLRSRW